MDNWPASAAAVRQRAAPHLAAASAHGRLDPLLLLLDEAANIAPIPRLPNLLADGGGTGITPVAVLQSLAHARARWGDAGADSMWDASTTDIVLGGLAHAEDLQRISRLAGDVDLPHITCSRSSGGHNRSTTTQRPPGSADQAPPLSAGRSGPGAGAGDASVGGLQGVLPPRGSRTCGVGSGVAEPAVVPERPVSWSALDVEQAAQQWRLLTCWVDWLRDRYQLHESVPACWYAHGAMVEELSALRSAWTAAYLDPHASPGDPALWHDVLDRTRSRLHQWDRQGCADGTRRPDLHIPDDADLQARNDHIHADLHGRPEQGE